MLDTNTSGQKHLVVLSSKVEVRKTKNQLSSLRPLLKGLLLQVRKYPFNFLTPFFLLLRIPESLWFGKAGHGSYVVAVFSVCVCVLFDFLIPTGAPQGEAVSVMFLLWIRSIPNAAGCRPGSKLSY